MNFASNNDLDKVKSTIAFGSGSSECVVVRCALDTMSIKFESHVSALVF